MAKSEGGESKVPQMIMVIFTSLVAPLVIFFVTNSVKNNPQPAETSATAVLSAEMGVARAVDPLTVSTATLASETQPTATPTTPATAAVPSSTPAATATAAASATTAPPAAPVNPTGLVAAGTAVTVDNFSLTLSQKDLFLEGEAIRLVFHVKNLSDQPREFSFIPGAVTVKDSKRVYAIYYGEKKGACQKADLGKKKTVTIPANTEVTITSTTTKEPVAWCANGKETTLPYYIGPVSKGTARLEIAVKGFGPFNGFSFDVPVKR